MSAAAAVAQSVPGNLPSSWSCSVSVSGSRPRLLSYSSRHACRAHAWCVLHVVPFRSRTLSLSRHQWRLRAFVSGEADDGVQRRQKLDQASFDDVLVFVETLCIAPSVVFAIGGVVSLVFPSVVKPLQSSLGNALFAWQFVLLVGAVAIGKMIRQRQWQRFCRDNGASVNLLDRIEKKLGIRFRVTRRTLKEPISETAALAQKNSEATRALAMHEDILEKELGEIQKVLLAMQEQQQKQLELILAIGKAGKVIDSRTDPEDPKREPAAGDASAARSPLPEKRAPPMDFNPGKVRMPANDHP
ncbi:unnamed protein product [Spirodela intermedia]|uniref:Uncharacterized protein n=1 Tax=Spirodela intermedia TaxID=51605 RepID=A0A7I8ILN5_SPIIN|nr:unnamed protein product [Spirodela intermedia]CAA6658846.1 unnamed protein product [Spirodela intermedia]